MSFVLPCYPSSTSSASLSLPSPHPWSLLTLLWPPLPLQLASCHQSVLDIYALADLCDTRILPRRESNGMLSFAIFLFDFGAEKVGVISRPSMGQTRKIMVLNSFCLFDIRTNIHELSVLRLAFLFLLIAELLIERPTREECLTTAR